MSDYVAIKPCNISGVKYYIGDKIPTGTLTEAQAASLIKRKKITSVKKDDRPTLFTLDIHIDKAETTVSLDNHNIENIFSILMMTSVEAIEMIKSITDERELLILPYVDTRKGVKEAVNNRIATLQNGAGTKDGAE